MVEMWVDVILFLVLFCTLNIPIENSKQNVPLKTKTKMLPSQKGSPPLPHPYVIISNSILLFFSLLVFITLCSGLHFICLLVYCLSLLLVVRPRGQHHIYCVDY